MRFRRDYPDTQKRRIDAWNSEDTERGTVETYGECRKKCAHKPIRTDTQRYMIRSLALGTLIDYGRYGNFEALRTPRTTADTGVGRYVCGH